MRFDYDDFMDAADNYPALTEDRPMPLSPTDRRAMAASVLGGQLRRAILIANGIEDAPLYPEVPQAEQELWATRAKAVIEFFSDPSPRREPAQSDTPWLKMSVSDAQRIINNEASRHVEAITPAPPRNEPAANYFDLAVRLARQQEK